MGFKTLLLAHKIISLTGHNDKEMRQSVCLEKNLRWKEFSGIQLKHSVTKITDGTAT